METTSKIRLVYPTEEYKDTFLEGAQALVDDGWDMRVDMELSKTDFPKFLQALADQDDEGKIAADAVPCIRLWMMVGDKYVGEVTVRRYLNESVAWSGHIRIAVIPTERGKGYATAGMAAAVDFMYQNKIVPVGEVLAATTTLNVAAQRFMLTTGFRIISLKQIEGRDTHLILYKHDLQQHLEDRLKRIERERQANAK